MSFFQACWDVLKADIMGVLHDFMLKAIDLKDFRLVSLVSGVYKIIANRLRRVVEKIISKSHNAFVKGRKILDLVLISK
jgi:hypothetical protein